MNKKILISLSVIGAVAALAMGGTIAYFSDVEESTGNTFTAGELDLIVDIDGEVFNPLDRTIFTEPDMKPGDNGEVTISLHVDNDACGFVKFDLTSDLDNSCTEPEGKDENATGNDDCDNAGELNDQVYWVIWRDEGGVSGWQCSDGTGTSTPACNDDILEGNNVLDKSAYEEILTYGPLDETKEWGFGKIVASNVYYYGFAWCFGDINQQTLVCDGSLVKNEAQTDSFSADMILTAEQYRNQYDQNDGCPFGELLKGY